MTVREVYHWLCGCGEKGTGEAAAQRHAKVCGRMGAPHTMPCPVTVPSPQQGVKEHPCGQPCVRHGLCARHAADKERLG